MYGNELFYVCDAIGFWAKNAAKLLSAEKIRPHLLMFRSKKVFSAYRPFGVIGIISPWNFPLVLSAGDAVPALMAERRFINHGATPLTALFVGRARAPSGIPENILQVVMAEENR